MMPGIGFAEMVLLVVVALVVIGPKDLPLMMRKFGRFTGKMRALAFEFKQGIDELGRQAELDELRKEVADLKKHTGLEDIQKEFEEDKRALETDVNKAMAPSAPAPAHPAASANGAATPAIASHAGLSADHPGYDTGDDFRIEGHGPPSRQELAPTPVIEPAPQPIPAPKAAAEPTPAPPPQPVKQDTPA
jgi:sec-independent protein translocase protein TatB